MEERNPYADNIIQDKKTATAKHFERRKMCADTFGNVYFAPEAECSGGWEVINGQVITSRSTDGLNVEVHLKRKLRYPDCRQLTCFYYESSSDMLVIVTDTNRGMLLYKDTR